VYYLTPFILFLFFATFVKGQEQLLFEYQLRLAQQGLEWLPQEEPFKMQKNPPMAFQEYDFAVSLRKEELEIRYFFVPIDPESDQAIVPHLIVPRMAMHLASNEEDSYLAAHEIAPALLDTVYYADWGQTFFFQPKLAFSTFENCQMIAFYREGVGLCYAFLLFNDPPPTLPERAKMMRFRPRKLQN
jgi:hypothetical protein